MKIGDDSGQQGRAVHGHMRILAIILRLGVIAAFGQAPPAFEVASVKPQAWTGKGNVGVGVHGNTLEAEHASLNDLVLFAYGLRDVQLSGGPAWADRSHSKLEDSELYQVIAKASGDPPPPTEAFRRMLQGLLADRFQLKIHRVRKELPIYNLVVSKGGPKLTESPADAKFSEAISPLGDSSARMVVTKMSMQRLADELSLYVDQPVFDKTGLTAAYDFILEFAFENMAGPADGPSPFTAVKKLGLKLESAIAPFDTVVIDYAERPSEN
jgi:uncharacterized protein (TIGR03435 family)